ncbi:hypothetical protein D3C74_430430 [compost metagenome]
MVTPVELAGTNIMAAEVTTLIITLVRILAFMPIRFVIGAANMLPIIAGTKLMNPIATNRFSLWK